MQRTDFSPLSAVIAGLASSALVRAERVARPRIKIKKRPKPTLGGGPILDRGSRRNMRRIEAIVGEHGVLRPDAMLRAQMRHRERRRDLQRAKNLAALASADG
jgi:hypothetical protein